MTVARQIQRITLRNAHVLKRRAEIEQEINAAIQDLLHEHSFVLRDGGITAPYDLVLGLEDHKLHLELQAEDGCENLILALQPLRPVIRSYFMICESYYAAAHSPNRSQIETIDAGRRGIHNEGAQMLAELLQDRVTLDHCTARRLFTLVAALHLGSWSNR
ncbi:MAG: UPF0262 family protein [Alphaproteobacteria bacterium]